MVCSVCLNISLLFVNSETAQTTGRGGGDRGDRHTRKRENIYLFLFTSLTDLKSMQKKMAINLLDETRRKKKWLKGKRRTKYNKLLVASF